MKTKVLLVISAFFIVISASAGWDLQKSGTTNFIWSVYFVDSDTGYASVENGTILKTTNGGTKWTSQTTGTQWACRAIPRTSTTQRKSARKPAISMSSAAFATSRRRSSGSSWHPASRSLSTKSPPG